MVGAVSVSSSNGGFATQERSIAAKAPTAVLSQVSVGGTTENASSPLLQGDPGPIGPRGLPGPSETSVFAINNASSFTASHSFIYPPRAWLIDDKQTAVETDVLYAPGQVTVIFPSPFNGTLCLG